MTQSPGRVLLADDNELFRRLTAERLCSEGYECDAVADAAAARKLLETQSYDLLIADIQMSGNAHMEFINSLPKICEGLQVVIVTGHPTMETAIQSYQTSVVAYLVKPFEFDQLKSIVQSAVERARIARGIASANSRLEEWRVEMKQIETSLKQVRTGVPHATVSAFFQLTFGNMAGALSDLHRLTDSLIKPQDQPEVCGIFNCPRGSALMAAVKETIDVLEKTKGAFKSKELGELRRKLEALISMDR